MTGSGGQGRLFDEPPGAPGEVRAAGVVVYRRAPGGVELLLLRHAGRRGWWTPPKGHLDPGEDDLTAAIRETEEETGIPAAALAIDPAFRREVRYEVWERRHRLAKVVVYYLGEAAAGATVRLSHEHSDFAWLPAPEACARVSYDNLREVLVAALAHLGEPAADRRGADAAGGDAGSGSRAGGGAP